MSLSIRCSASSMSMCASHSVGRFQAMLFLTLATLSLWTGYNSNAQGQINSADPVWVKIPAGRFLMGSQVPAEQLAKDFRGYGRPAEYFSDEYPQHMVEISKPFLMSQTEITVGQFRKFVEATGYQAESIVDGTGAWGFDKVSKKCVGRDTRFSWKDAGYAQSDDHPVVNLTHDDCRAYCQWLSKQTGKTVRLPTEAEWEYACRAGSHDYYNMGNSIPQLLSGARTLQPTDKSILHSVQDLEIIDDQMQVFPKPVGSYPPNAFGLYDMHGNVWEWTADWYDENYYAHSPLKDPPGPGDGRVKVRRGGGWNTFPLWARASFRNWNSTDSRCINLGFRVVAELSPNEISGQAPPLRRNSASSTSKEPS